MCQQTCDCQLPELDLPTWVLDPTDIDQMLTYYHSVVVGMTRNRVEWERTNDPENLQKEFYYQEELGRIRSVILHLASHRVASADELIAENKALKAELSSNMADMDEANAVLAHVVEQSRQIRESKN